MRLIRATDADDAAIRAAGEIATACRGAVAARGRALVAVSGGETPWRMLKVLRTLPLPWTQVHVAQVDERVAPPGDPRRNLSRLEQLLVADGPLPPANLLAMPVEDAGLPRAAADYQRRLAALAGAPPVLDLVQLGLGTDGHTASLVPGDAVLAITDRDVAVTGDYQGLRRMTLTFPVLDRARRRLWLVTGAAKAARLADLLDGGSDDRAPAMRVIRSGSVVVADGEALASAGRCRLASNDRATPPAGDH